MTLTAVLLSSLLSWARAAEPAVEKSTAPRAGSIDAAACFVAGAGEPKALKALRFMSGASEHGSSFRAEKFFQTKKEYTPTAGGCDISIRVASSEEGAAAEAFSSRTGKLLFIERQEALTKDSCMDLYAAVAARFRKSPELLGKADEAQAPKPEAKEEAKPQPEEKPLPELPSSDAKPQIAPMAAPAPAPAPSAPTETPKQ